MCRPGDPPEVVAAHVAGGRRPGSRCASASPDEILLRGPNVMLGYLDDPEATAEAIDADGWLHTGDVGTLDEDGYLTITDRLKDMYICGGFNVYPAEVEQALARLDGVAESAVIGVPDERLGEVGQAFVVAAARCRAGRARTCSPSAGAAGQLQGAARRWSSATRCPATRPARCSSACCGRRHLMADEVAVRACAGAIALVTMNRPRVPQRAELGDDLRAGRGVPPGGRRRRGRGDRAGRRGQALLAPGTTSAPRGATSDSPSTAGPCMWWDHVGQGRRGRPRYAREIGGLPGHVPALAGDPEADHRDGAGRVHRRRADAGLGAAT